MKIVQHRLSVQAWLALLALALVGWFIINHSALLLELLWILLGAYILSVSLRPTAQWWAQRQIPRGVTVMLAYLLLFGLIGGAIRLLTPVVIDEATRLRQAIPTIIPQAASYLTTAPIARWLPLTTNLTQAFEQQVDRILLELLGTVAGLGDFLLDLLLILILAYFFTVSADSGQTMLWRWLKPTQQAQLQTMLTTIETRLTRWVWTQLGLGFYHACAFSIGLLLLGVPFALTIGLLGGLLSLFPYLGITLTAALAAFSVLPMNPWLALWVVLYMLAVTIVGNHVITPVLYGRTVGLNAVVALLALFVGAKLLGITGVLFAIPIAIVVTTMVETMTAAATIVDAQTILTTTDDDRSSHEGCQDA